MRNQILEDLKTAMKNQDKELLNVIRMVKGAIQLEEINLKRELTDEDKTYLRLKWGKTYRPVEWVQLEQLYDEMMQSYDI
mgnify:CR=1 FL=1